MAITKVTTPELIDLPNNQLVTGVSTTYNITVISSGGNKYAVNGVQQPDITLIPGTIYIINQDDSTNNAHPLILSTSSGAAGVYSTGVTYSLNGANVSYASYISGFAAATQRRLTINLSSPPTLSYICYYHSGMGSNVSTTPGTANTDGVVLPKGSTIAQNLTVDYLLIAGGGGGGGNNSGGGGAGGYLTSYDSDPSGDNSATLTALSLSFNTAYTVTVGAGGAGVASGIPDQNGGIGLDSVFATLTANGGGCGRASGGAVPGEVDGGSGGGGAYGAVAGQTKGIGTTLQGGDGFSGAGGSPYNGGGGGGASGDASGINGANGLVSTIDGGTTTRAGGGGGGQDPNSPSSGGTGGGGAGGTQSYNGGVGTVNTGSGGGGGGFTTGSSGGAGGSGIIILRYPNIFTATYTAGTGGVAGTETAIGTSDKYIIITAGTGTVTFSGTPTVGRPTTNLNIGEFRYNTTDKKVEYYDGADWFTLTNTTVAPQPGTTGACSYPTTATALFQFDNNIVDTCGNHTASWSGTAAYSSTAKFGSHSAYLTGGTGGPYINTGVNPNDSPDWTVSFWVYRTQTTRLAWAIGSTAAGPPPYSPQYGYAIQIQQPAVSNGYIEFTVNSSYTHASFQGGSVSGNLWEHIAVTHNASANVSGYPIGDGVSTVYQNGALITTNLVYGNNPIPNNGFNGVSQANWCLGSPGTWNPYQNRRLEGYVDQARFFNTELNATQIEQLYNETAP